MSDTIKLYKGDEDVTVDAKPTSESYAYWTDQGFAPDAAREEKEEKEEKEEEQE